MGMVWMARHKVTAGRSYSTTILCSLLRSRGLASHGALSPQFEVQKYISPLVLFHNPGGVLQLTTLGLCAPLTMGTAFYERSFFDWIASPISACSKEFITSTH